MIALLMPQAARDCGHAQATRCLPHCTLSKQATRSEAFLMREREVIFSPY
jgi:hypothetical protein